MMRQWLRNIVIRPITERLGGMPETHTRTLEPLYSGQQLRGIFWCPEDDPDQWLAGGGENRSMPPLILPGR